MKLLLIIVQIIFYQGQSFEGYTQIAGPSDSLVISNCTFKGVLDLKGSHNYVLIENCVFTNNTKKTLRFHAEIDKPQRVGSVNIIGNIFYHNSRGSAVFGQKFTSLFFKGNTLYVDGEKASGLKIDDADSKDILIIDNRFFIKQGWSAITLESSRLPTDSVRVYDNYLTHKIGFIHTIAEGSRFMGNTFDFSEKDESKPDYYYRNREYPGSVWIYNVNK